MDNTDGTSKLLAGVMGYVLLYFGILWLIFLGMTHPRTAWAIVVAVLVAFVVAVLVCIRRAHSSPSTN